MLFISLQLLHKLKKRKSGRFSMVLFDGNAAAGGVSFVPGLSILYSIWIHLSGQMLSR
jgi:hypothetical protein